MLAVTGPHQYEAVLDAVHAAVPPAPDPFVDLLPASGVHLTPRHYSYLKISEGCNHKCKFCIIPDMRGKLVSRPAHAVLREAEKLVEAGVKELLVISQDTSAYGLDRRHDENDWHGRPVRSHITDLARELGTLGAWVRLHYVYPYPHVRDLIPLMAEGAILPYLDIPFQHSHPDVLRRMARPAASARTLDEIAAWRAVCPDIALRSTFIVGYPGETEAEFQHLLDWLDEARLDRVGCFQYENVAGARANALPDHVAPEVKQDRWNRFMETRPGHQRRQTRSQGRHRTRRHRRHRRRGRGHLPHQGRRAGNRRQPLHRRGFRDAFARRHPARHGRGGVRIRPVGRPPALTVSPRSRASDRRHTLCASAPQRAPRRSGPVPAPGTDRSRTSPPRAASS